MFTLGHVVCYSCDMSLYVICELCYIKANNTQVELN